MVTKLKAAKTMMRAGKQMVLASGRDPRIVLQILAGDPVGTWFGQPKQAASVVNWLSVIAAVLAARPICSRSIVVASISSVSFFSAREQASASANVI